MAMSPMTIFAGGYTQQLFSYIFDPQRLKLSVNKTFNTPTITPSCISVNPGYQAL
jgi:hypothetical protein